MTFLVKFGSKMKLQEETSLCKFRIFAPLNTHNFTSFYPIFLIFEDLECCFHALQIITHEDGRI